jgi:hypothetical protein
VNYTDNYNLRKPELTDPVDIDDLNYNADEIDSLLKGLADGLDGITPEGIGAETPTGAQQKANQAETNAKSYADQVASDLSNQAETNAKSYADIVANGVLNSAKDYADIVTNNALNSAKDYADGVLESANSHTDQVASDLSQKLNKTRIKVLDVEQDVSNINKVLINLNPNHEAKQTVSGYGTVTLPKNAANGQFSDVRIKGNTATNIVKNGNFVDGTAKWVTSGATISVSSNVLSVVASGVHLFPYVKNSTGITAKTGQKIFVRAKVRVTNDACLSFRLGLFPSGGGGSNITLVENPVINQWYTMSHIFNIGTTTGGEIIPEIYNIYADAITANGKVMEVKEVMAIDLTAHGLDSLTVDQCNQRFPYWFDGTKSTISASRLKSVGKNLFEGEISAYRQSGNIYFDGSQLYFKRISTGTYSGAITKIKTEIGKTYIVSWKYISGDISYSIRILDKYYRLITSIPTSPVSFTATTEETYILFTGTRADHEGTILGDIQVEEGNQATEYEPYKESVAYITAKDDDGNIVELRSLPNGTKDEVSNGKHIQRIGTKTNVVSGTVINYADMADGGTYYAWNEDGETETGIKGDTLGIDATTLTYQLATPIEIPIQASGSLVSYPSGTVYIEPYVADAGIYTDKIEVLHEDLPIKALEKISKVDFDTGLETELDITAAVIAEDKLSFTHPNLTSGDIVFFTYEYDRESTEGETEIEYYDSRYVIIDSVTGKIYKWQITVANGVPSIELVEV